MRLVFRCDKHARNQMAGEELKTIAKIIIELVAYKGSDVRDIGSSADTENAVRGHFIAIDANQ
jgi:hypothetical protein